MVHPSQLDQEPVVKNVKELIPVFIYPRREESESLSFPVHETKLKNNGEVLEMTDLQFGENRPNHHV